MPTIRIVNNDGAPSAIPSDVLAEMIGVQFHAKVDLPGRFVVMGHDFMSALRGAGRTKAIEYHGPMSAMSSRFFDKSRCEVI